MSKGISSILLISERLNSALGLMTNTGADNCATLSVILLCPLIFLSSAARLFPDYNLIVAIHIIGNTHGLWFVCMEMS